MGGKVHELARFQFVSVWFSETIEDAKPFLNTLDRLWNR